MQMQLMQILIQLLTTMLKYRVASKRLHASEHLHLINWGFGHAIYAYCIWQTIIWQSAVQFWEN